MLPPSLWCLLLWGGALRDIQKTAVKETGGGGGLGPLNETHKGDQSVHGPGFFYP